MWSLVAIWLNHLEKGFNCRFLSIRQNIDVFFLNLNQSIKEGVIALKISPEPDLGPFDLTIQIDDGRYLPLIGEFLEEEGDELGTIVNVKTIKCYEYSGEEVAILGDFYPIEHTTKDKDFIKSLLIEFLRNFDISTQLMN